MDEYESVQQEDDDTVFFAAPEKDDDDIIIDTFPPKDEEEEDSVETKHNYTTRLPHPYTNKGIRDKIAQQLGIKYKNEKNGGILEKHIYNAAIALCRLRNIPLKATDTGFQLVYSSVAYEVLSSVEGIKEVIERLKSGAVEWKAPRYRELLEARSTEEADHSQDVVEGIHECNDCKKAGRVFNKTRNTQIQTRGGDEGMTVFVTCVVCRKMWKQYN
jgi:DNA-directed RNA polymerase subunit M/transcription elongation factor TFIIS